MSTRPSAKLFYGYIQPDPKDDDKDEEDKDDKPESNWEKTHCEESHGCEGGICGYDGNLKHFIAVKDSLHEVEWDEVKELSIEDLKVKPGWDRQLLDARAHFKVNTDSSSSWHLVCLYF